MRLIIFRHAEKAFEAYNPDLTPHGHQQAKKIAQLVAEKTLPQPTLIYSSPKKRALSTFHPLSELTGIATVPFPALDERMWTENLEQFHKRIDHFFNEIEKLRATDEVIYACSHFDWVEEFMTRIDCDKDLTGGHFSHWGTAQYMILQKADFWHLIDFRRIT